MTKDTKVATKKVTSEGEKELLAAWEGVKIPITAFPTMGLTLRMKVSRAVGEVMQYVEMSALTPEAQKAMKDSIKRSMWGSVTDFIKYMGELSQLPEELISEVAFSANSEKGGWASHGIEEVEKVS